MINLYLDTNKIFPDNYKIFKKIEFCGDYSKLELKCEQINKIKKIVQICIPELVLEEFKTQCCQNFIKLKEEVDKSNKRYRDIFGNNMISTNVVAWENVDEYKRFLEEEISKYLEEKSETIKLVPTPDCFDKIISRALKKEPLFVETKRGEKTYYDAGFKDNVIYETILSYMGEYTIFCTRDKDFTPAKADITIVNQTEQIEETIMMMYPEYELYSIISNLNGQYLLSQISNYLNYDLEESQLIITDFLKKEFVFDELDNVLTLIVEANIKEEKVNLKIVYDKEANEVMMAEFV